MVLREGGNWKSVLYSGGERNVLLWWGRGELKIYQGGVGWRQEKKLSILFSIVL